MLADHAGDVPLPIAMSGALQVIAGQVRRGCEVIEGPRRPDAEVVKGRGQRHFFQRGLAGGLQRQAQIGYPVRVVAIGDVIGAERLRVIFQHRVERGDALEQHQAGRRFSIQARMSAMTGSLPRSLSGSWK